MVVKIFGFGFSFMIVYTVMAWLFPVTYGRHYLSSRACASGIIVGAHLHLLVCTEFMQYGSGFRTVRFRSVPAGKAGSSRERVYLAKLPGCASAGLEIGQLSLLVDLLTGKIKPGTSWQAKSFSG